MAYPDTYYKRTMADQTARPALSGTVECDVAIVGGGLAGLSAALQLARAGRSVTVLEAESVGFGASGRNGGFVSPGYATGGEEIARIAGKEKARQLHLLSVEGVDFVRDNIRTLAIADARPVPGIMSVLRYDDGASLKAYAQEVQREYGYELEYMDRDAVRAVLKSERYFQALRNPNAFHMHPLNYLRGLAREIERLGGRICEQSAVTATNLGGAEKRLTTAGGAVKARDVLFTTGGYTGPLNGRLKRAFLPIATYVMVSEEAPELIASAIATTDAIGDNRRAGDYYRVIDDGRRVLWGGRITTHAASAGGVEKELRAQRGDA